MKKALIFYGGWSGHTPFETTQVFKNILEQNNFTVSVSDTMEILDTYENIEGYNLFVPMYTMGEISEKQMDNISKAIRNGAGIAGCHGGMCDAFRNNTEWQFMTGAQWVAHPGNSEVTYTVHLKENTLFTEGLGDFNYTGEQYYLHVDPAVTVYATTDFPVFEGPHSANGKVSMPVIFTKKWGEGKVFYLSLGHSYKDFEIPEIKTIMKRGLLWAAK